MPSPLLSRFLLDPRLLFLNHGSFGACPRAVLDHAAEWREHFERDPVAFVLHQLEPALDRARAAAGRFLGAEPRDLAFVDNTTTGVCTVLAGFPLAQGDEILVTNHGYNACNNAALEFAARSGARVAVARVPFPLSDPGQVVETVLAAVTDRTRLALVDHVTSPTGLVLPIAELVRELRARGVVTLVDGAHAPGMLPLEIASLGADYYTGNFHKWCCAPKGTAFLWVSRERQPAQRPLVVSHGARSPRTDRSRFMLEFDWVGTRDDSGVLSLPFALEYVGNLLSGGWHAAMANNRELALRAREVLLEAVGGSPACPASMIGALAAVCLPDARAVVARPGWAFAEPLYSRLYEHHRIQALVTHWPGPPAQLVRVSAALYNDLEDFRVLSRALVAELGKA